MPRQYRCVELGVNAAWLKADVLIDAICRRSALEELVQARLSVALRGGGVPTI